MRIKICGITNLDDALMSIEAGADMLGFNFYPPTPRYISPATCARLISKIDSRGLAVRYVGVFVNTPAIEVASILDECGLDLAQFSGDESPQEVLGMSSRAFKALRPQSIDDALIQAQTYANKAITPSLLVDAYRAGLYGGTGRIANWGTAKVIADHYPILLAGGLNAGNVASAISEVHPWGVDVASGVEESPGRKDRQKLLDFMHAVRTCHAEIISC